MSRSTGRTTAAAPSYETFSGNAAENYERYFVPALGEPVARHLLEAAALRPGEHVLDVACGTGIVARLAAERVGSDGRVDGLDVNPGMLAVARTVAPTVNEWHEASADAIPLPDASYDVVLCGMGLQFFGDRPAALREMRRVLSPGGRLAFNVPGPTPEVLRIMGEVLAQHVAPQIAMFVDAVFSLHDPDEIRSLLEDAGFTDVSVDANLRRLRVPEPAAFLWQYVQSTPMSEPLGQVDPAVRDALQRDFVARCAPFTEDGSLVIEVNMTETTARK